MVTFYKGTTLQGGLLFSGGPLLLEFDRGEGKKQSQVTLEDALLSEFFGTPNTGL